jgi:hypothetical protein
MKFYINMQIIMASMECNLSYDDARTKKRLVDKERLDVFCMQFSCATKYLSIYHDPVGTNRALQLRQLLGQHVQCAAVAATSLGGDTDKRVVRPQPQDVPRRRTAYQGGE